MTWAAREKSLVCCCVSGMNGFIMTAHTVKTLASPAIRSPAEKVSLTVRIVFWLKTAQTENVASRILTINVWWRLCASYSYPYSHIVLVSGSFLNKVECRLKRYLVKHQSYFVKHHFSPRWCERWVGCSLADPCTCFNSPGNAFEWPEMTLILELSLSHKKNWSPQRNLCSLWFCSKIMTA